MVALTGGILLALATWQRADEAANKGQARDLGVVRTVARLEAATARMEAVECNRRHEYDAAGSILERAAERIAGLVPNFSDDGELLRLVQKLCNQAQTLRGEASEHYRKLLYHTGYQTSRSRRRDGTSPRRGQVDDGHADA